MGLTLTNSCDTHTPDVVAPRAPAGFTRSAANSDHEVVRRQSRVSLEHLGDQGVQSESRGTACAWVGPPIAAAMAKLAIARAIDIPLLVSKRRNTTPRARASDRAHDSCE